MKTLTLTPDEFGFRQYADDLQREIKGLAPLYYPKMVGPAERRRMVEQVKALQPDLVHIHHEFGFLGSKTPLKYQFPKFVRELRAALPQVKIVATAHTTLGQNFKYPVQGRGWQAPLRAAANLLLLPWIRPLWIQRTWGILDGVIVHSRHQLPAVEASGCPKAVCIPHYVPNRYEAVALGQATSEWSSKIPNDKPIVLVFGYFTPEKAQDVVIRAMAHLKGRAFLILGGGVRRDADQRYFNHCQSLIQELGLAEHTLTTGFLSWENLDYFCSRASLVVIPFRETSGSGSLADLLARKMPVLASDLPLNLEISEREKGALAFFKSEDAADCAAQIQKLLESPPLMQELKSAAERYAAQVAPEQMGKRHLEFYKSVLS